MEMGRGGWVLLQSFTLSGVFCETNGSGCPFSGCNLYLCEILKSSKRFRHKTVTVKRSYYLTYTGIL